MKITIINGDITKIKADAIVNAANSQLVRGGGVDGAIHNAAGPELQKECQNIKNEFFPKGLQVGQVIKTNAYNLPAKIVIHTVGPKFYLQNINLLKDCYVNCLKCAEENNCKSISFPAISTGAYGCPIEKSAQIVKGVLQNFKSEIIIEVFLVLFEQKDFLIYQREFNS